MQTGPCAQRGIPEVGLTVIFVSKWLACPVMGMSSPPFGLETGQGQY